MKPKQPITLEAVGSVIRQCQDAEWHGLVLVTFRGGRITRLKKEEMAFSGKEVTRLLDKKGTCGVESK